jgi:hypothetical protein
VVLPLRGVSPFHLFFFLIERTRTMPESLKLLADNDNADYQSHLVKLFKLFDRPSPLKAYMATINRKLIAIADLPAQEFMEVITTLSDYLPKDRFMASFSDLISAGHAYFEWCHLWKIWNSLLVIHYDKWSSILFAMRVTNTSIVNNIGPKYITTVNEDKTKELETMILDVNFNKK